MQSFNSCLSNVGLGDSAIAQRLQTLVQDQKILGYIFVQAGPCCASELQ